MIKFEDVYSKETVVRLKKTQQFALIKERFFMKHGCGFLHYLAEIEDRTGLYAIYHQDIELECLTLKN